MFPFGLDIFGPWIPQIVVHRGWEVLTQNNFCTRKTYWLDGDLSGFPLPFLYRFIRFFVVLLLRQITLSWSNWRSRWAREREIKVTSPTLVIESIAFVAPILGLYYILTIYCILTTMGLHVGFLGNTNFLDVKNCVSVFLFSVDPMPNCRRDHFVSGYGAGDGWLWSLPNPI